MDTARRLLWFDSCSSRGENAESALLTKYSLSQIDPRDALSHALREKRERQPL